MKLQLKYDGKAAGAIHGAFIRGKSPESWFSTLQTWDIALNSLEIYAIPESVRSLKVAGLFVVFQPEKLPLTNLISEPYTCLGNTFFIPTNSRLSPTLGQNELDKIMVWPRQIFHPIFGLSGFEKEDKIDLISLFILPSQKETVWQSPPKANPSQPKLNRISLPPINTKEVIKDFLDQIEKKPIDEIPGKEEEGSDFLENLEKGFFKGAHSLSKGLNDSLRGIFGESEGEDEGLLTNFENWLGKKSDDLENKRKKEIDRLLNLFKDNPGEALKYALPLDSSYLNRGNGMSSSGLSRKNPNFSLGGLGGGQATDSWNIGNDYYLLRDQYQKAAEEAVAMGDFRLAAYIYAHLLANFHSAANVLQQGKYFREAAALYIEHLKDKNAAAKCLQEGGLYFEAIELYLELGKHETAGYLYEELGQWENALLWYEKANELALTNHDLLKAARIQQNKIKDPERALNTLLSGWKESKQASQCLAQYLELHAKLRQQELAESFNNSFQNHVSEEQRSDFLDVLLKIVKDKKDESLRAGTLEIAYELISEQAIFHNQPKRLYELQDFLPKDRLLKGDASRYLQSRPEPKKFILSLPDSPKQELQLDHSIRWVSVTAHRNQFLAIGTKKDSLFLARGNWENKIKYYVLASNITAENRFRLNSDPILGNKIFLKAKQEIIFDRREFSSDAHFNEDIEVIQPTWLPDNLLSFNLSNKGQISSLCFEHNNLSFKQYTLDGHLTKSIDLRLDVPGTAGEEISPLSGPGLFMRKGFIYFTLGHVLARFNPGSDQKIEKIFLNQPIRFMAVSAPHSLVRLAIALENGLMYYRQSQTQFRHEGVFLSCDFVPIDLKFAPNYNLIVCGRNKVKVYDLSRENPVLKFEMELEDEIIGILLPYKRNRFALLYANGLLKVYQLD